MASTGTVKEEYFRPLPYSVKIEQVELPAARCATTTVPLVEISSSTSSDGDRSGYGDVQNGTAEVTSPLVSKRSNCLDNTITNGPAKRPRLEANGHSGVLQKSSACLTDMNLPDDFLQPLEEIPSSFSPAQAAMVPSPPSLHPSTPQVTDKVFRQFWKAGDYESDNKARHKPTSGGMDHVRVHPKFLHSNATSHKWALGAVAELLDNALDEAVHGATFVKVEMIRNPKNGDPMLLVEDDGGGMNPDNMRQCMSLGYSVKSKIANTIGQYGNGFKTSTMRLGADVIVFSRCRDSKGLGPTESVGMLSYTFLRETGQEDIIVPMIDYEIQPFGLRKLIRRNVEDWNRNMESLVRWSPYGTEAQLLDNFKGMKEQGTKIIVYNLWEDDQGLLELDFVTNQHDIQVRGANRDEQQISMAALFPNSRHYLTYRHSLRSYASILYLRLPPGFKMFLRGKEIEHHNLIDDLMFTEALTYRPVGSDVKTADNCQMKAVVTLGFVKDAKEHIDVQGFNVYHKNRLIKPFWRLWNSAGSRGRGIIGVLEANFVEPAHDKQGFERTIVLARLEARLVEMQKTYWSKHCHKVGYVNNSVKGRATEQREMSSSGGVVHPATHVVATSVPMPMPLAIIPEPFGLPAQAEYQSGVHTPNVPVLAGVARSMQLQTQVELGRPEYVHGVSAAKLEAFQQVGPSALPHAVGIPSQRPKAPAANHNGLQDPAFSLDINAQALERFSSLARNATRSSLPLPTSSALPMPTEFARRGTPSPVASVVTPLRPQISPASRTMSQALPTNYVAPACVSVSGNVNSSVASQSSMQDPSICGYFATGNVGALPRAAAQSVDHSYHMLQGTTSGTNHDIQNSTLSPESGRENVQKDSVPAVFDIARITSLTGEANRVPSVNEEQVHSETNGHTGGSCEESGQMLSKAGMLSPPRASVESMGASPFSKQPVVQTTLEGTEHSRQSGEAAENQRVASICTPSVTPSSSLLGSVPVYNQNTYSVTHTQPDHGVVRVPKLSNKEGRKSLEDLGRMFARKAASITMNQGENVNNVKHPNAGATEPLGSDYSLSTIGNRARIGNNEMEAYLLEKELEVIKLQHRLETLRAERDSLKQQLLEERLRGQLSKQELQQKVEETWAKVRELEAQNHLQLAQQ